MWLWIVYAVNLTQFCTIHRCAVNCTRSFLVFSTMGVWNLAILAENHAQHLNHAKNMWHSCTEPRIRFVNSTTVVVQHTIDIILNFTHRSNSYKLQTNSITRYCGYIVISDFPIKINGPVWQNERNLLKMAMISVIKGKIPRRSL